MRKTGFGFALLCLLWLPALPVSADSTLDYIKMQVQIARVEIQADVSFDDAAESLKLRANQHNIKFVGASPLYKEIEALTGKPARRMEIFSFCDATTALQMAEADTLTISFMPCRIALLEDIQGKRWVVSMLMDEALFRKLPDATRKNAERVMGFMKDMMLAAARGDL
ncbi:MAG: DUF302 domain-containing protein [Sideroxydans sp.]|jgi:uncharacterized protein (DUF302 family)